MIILTLIPPWQKYTCCRWSKSDMKEKGRARLMWTTLWGRPRDDGWSEGYRQYATKYLFLHVCILIFLHKGYFKFEHNFAHRKSAATACNPIPRRCATPAIFCLLRFCRHSWRSAIGTVEDVVRGGDEWVSFLDPPFCVSVREGGFRAYRTSFYVFLLARHQQQKYVT